MTTKTDDTDEIRCAGCGKIIEIGDDATRIVQGKVTQKEFREKKLWGVMHPSCFNRAIDSPEAVLEEIRASRVARKKSA
jgi:hypothetical protein